MADSAVDGMGSSRGLGAIGGAAGLAASVFVLFGPVVRYTSESADGTRTSGTVSGIDYLFGSPHAQFELFAWPVLLGVVAVIGAVAAWRGHGRWLWSAALALAAFTVVGLMTLGLLYAPAAFLLLAAALLGRNA